MNLLIALVLGGAVVLPLVHRATRVKFPRAEAARSAEPRDENPHDIHAHVSLRFVHAPQNVRVKSNDAILREWNPVTAEFLLEDSVSLPLNEGRAELNVQIQWPAGTPDTNVVMHVEPDGLPARTATVWSSGGSADELVTLSWKGEEL